MKKSLAGPAKSIVLNVGLLLTMVASGWGQDVTLGLGVGSASPGGTASLDLNITAAAGISAATIQWTISYPGADVSAIQVLAGAAATAAGKTVLCNQSTSSISCIAYGLDSRGIGSGVLALVNVSVRSTSVATTIPLTVSPVTVSSGAAFSLTASGGTGTVAVAQSVLPTLSTLTCPAATLTAPGSMNCTVTISASAGAAGFPITLSSNNAGVTVPGTVTVASGSTSAGFAVLASSGAANQTVVLTAAAGAVSRTQTISLTPLTWSISGAVGTAGAGSTVSLQATLAGAATASSASAATIPTANLVAAYAFDEGSGSAANDTSGNGNHGTINQAAWAATGRYGRALSFNGTSSMVTVPDAPGLDATSAVTVEAWVNPVTSSNWRSVVMKESASGLAYALYASDDRGLPGGYANLGSADLNATGVATIPAGTWSHLAMTFDGSTIRLYVNGTEVSSTPASGALITTGSPLRIGGNAVWGEFFQGLIDEIRIYNRVLTGAEIQADMQTPLTVTPPPAIISQVDGAGNFVFANLSSGTYTVTPVRAGTTFIPASRDVVVSGSNVSGVNFTVQASTFSVAGSLGAAGAGASVTITGAASATVTADTAGNFSFPGLVNGNYTVTPARAGVLFTPLSLAVTVNGANVTGVNFASQVLTWSISGALGATGAGASVALTGAASRTATADAAGNYSFTGLANGAYTVTPTKAGVTFTPTSLNATVNGANLTGLNFTSAGQTWSISGALGATGAGASVALTGAASRTATADAAGNYSFTSLANGAYTVTPTKAGVTFTPLNRAVTINGTDASGVNFSGQVFNSGSVIPDVNVSRVQTVEQNWITSPSFSITSGNQLILAMVASCRHAATSNNARVRSVTGGGLTWVRVIRTNIQDGTAEIWRAVAPSPINGAVVRADFTQDVSSSITILSFTGADTASTSGPIGAIASRSAATGTPQATLTTTRANSLVVGVGSDVRLAVARSVINGQILTSQHLINPDHTFWTQRLDKGVAAAGTAVTLGVSAPTTAKFNFSIAEILPAPANATLQMLAAPPARVSSVESAKPDSGRALSTSGKQEPESARLTLANAATGLAGDACSPGGLATLFGTRLMTTGGELARANQFPLPRKLAGVEVLVNGEAAPLLMVSSDQINFQCPASPAGTPLDVVVRSADEQLGSVSTVMQEVAPGLFRQADGDRGMMQVAGEGHPQDPARRGEDYVTVYASGLGESVERVESGMAAPADRLSPLRRSMRVWIGGVPVTPTYAGLAPGSAGLYQINFQIPPASAVGFEVPLLLETTLSDGRVLYSNTVKIAVREGSSDQ